MVEWTRNTQWRQGHLLSSDAITALGFSHPTMPENTVVVVATHDCDIVQVPEKEPCVEVFVGQVIASENKDGNNTHAKNARKLHIEFGGNSPLWVEFEATSKTSIKKADLASFTPCTASRLSPDNYNTFQMWLASRYRRSAFPDEFERRLTKEAKLAEKISNAVKPHGDLISGVFFDVDGGKDVIRNGPDDTYMLDIIVLYTSEPDVISAENAANEAVSAIEKAFKEKLFNSTKKWQHIELRFCDAISEAALTYQVFKQLKRWRLDHVSLASVPQQPVLAG